MLNLFDGRKKVYFSFEVIDLFCLKTQSKMAFLRVALGFSCHEICCLFMKLLTQNCNRTVPENDEATSDDAFDRKLHELYKTFGYLAHFIYVLKHLIAFSQC